MPRWPDVHALAATAPTPHPLFKRFDRPMCGILVHVHIGAVVAVEAINCNRMDAVLAHVGEVHRGGQLFACSLIMEASCCSKSDSFRSSCARRASASLAFMLRLRKAVAMFLCLTTARTAFATRASASARRCKYFTPIAMRLCTSKAPKQNESC